MNRSYIKESEHSIAGYAMQWNPLFQNDQRGWLFQNHMTQDSAGRVQASRKILYRIETDLSKPLMMAFKSDRGAMLRLGVTANHISVLSLATYNEK